MNEQILLDYEGLKYMCESLTDEINALNAKLFHASTTNYEKIGHSEYRDKRTERIAKREELQKKLDALLLELQKVNQAYKIAISNLDPVEKNYCYHRYILHMTNKEIAKSFCCPLGKIFEIRQGLLFKIKNL